MPFSRMAPLQYRHYTKLLFARPTAALTVSTRAKKLQLLFQTKSCSHNTTNMALRQALRSSFVAFATRSTLCTVCTATAVPAALAVRHFSNVDASGAVSKFTSSHTEKWMQVGVIVYASELISVATLIEFGSTLKSKKYVIAPGSWQESHGPHRGGSAYRQQRAYRHVRWRYDHL